MYNLYMVINCHLTVEDLEIEQKPLAGEYMQLNRKITKLLGKKRRKLIVPLILGNILRGIKTKHNFKQALCKFQELRKTQQVHWIYCILHV